MRPPSQIIRGRETVVHSLIKKGSHFRWVHHHKLYEGKTVVHSLIDKESLQMRPPSQIIRGETVVHSLIYKESLQMRPPSQIKRGETVVHSLIDKKSPVSWVCFGNFPINLYLAVCFLFLFFCQIYYLTRFNDLILLKRV